MPAIGWKRVGDSFLLFSDEKGLRKHKAEGLTGFSKKGTLKAAVNSHGIGMAESVLEGDTDDLLGRSLKISKNLEEACYNYLRDFQKGVKAKVNLLVCNKDRGVNVELFGNKFSIAQDERMIARTEHFEVFSDLNKNTRKSEEKLEIVKKTLAKKSPKELSKEFSVIKMGKTVEFL